MGFKIRKIGACGKLRKKTRTLAALMVDYGEVVHLPYLSRTKH